MLPDPCARRTRTAVALLVALALTGTACGASTGAVRVTQPTTSAPTVGAPTASTGGAGPTTTTPLTAPQASVGQDAQYFTEVGEVDPTLATYEQKQGNVALRALLTDGSAFCAFLALGGGVDRALVAVAEGAEGDESQTHLPQSVTTFNAVEAVSLLTLCPSEQHLLPSSDQARVRALGSSLQTRPG